MVTHKEDREREIHNCFLYVGFIGVMWTVNALNATPVILFHLYLHTEQLNTSVYFKKYVTYFTDSHLSSICPCKKKKPSTWQQQYTTTVHNLQAIHSQALYIPF